MVPAQADGVKTAPGRRGVLSWPCSSRRRSSVAMSISGGDNSTLARTMFNALLNQVDSAIAAIFAVMIVISSLLVVLSQILGRSRL
jgi:ABC-type spermidine/putrescine transport system permease subunit II